MSTPLVPTGTLRARFAGGRASAGGAPGTAGSVGAVFRRLGIGAEHCDLGDEGLYLAEELVAADGWFGGADQSEALAVLVLALMLAQRQGSACLSLAPGEGDGRLTTLVRDIVRIAGGGLDARRILKTIGHLTSAPRFGSVIGNGDARSPLIVDDHALYTERSRWLEVRVAARLAQRLAAPLTVDPARLDDVMADLAARPGGRALSTEQAAAVKTALGSSLAVITGGPGTGKTVVAAALVRGLVRLGTVELALAAQTGKAANRLTEVIAEQLAAVGEPSCGDRALAAKPPVAQTLHRLLGARGGRFAHHALSPLPMQAVIVDEASMIDLELMDALLDALPLTSPLILLGDAHQLPAIDAGQILADLVQHAADHPAGLPGAGAAHVATLHTSYRMNPSDVAGRAVYEAAQAVNTGAAHKLVQGAKPLAVERTPGRLQCTAVEWVDAGAPAVAKPGAAANAVAEQLWHRFEGPAALRTAEHVFRFLDGQIDPADAPDLEALWRTLGRARILTATRALPTGAIAINAHLHALALARMSVTGKPEFVPGEPVMITANDYQRGLFNGDQGIIVRADEGLGRHHFRALFRCGGALRPFAIEALRDRLELAWALTVHKSQGSELDAIALVLPDEDLPLVTRELLYTGITRARTSVVLCASKPILIAAGKRRALRYSGLPARLARALAARQGGA